MKTGIKVLGFTCSLQPETLTVFILSLTLNFLTALKERYKNDEISLQKKECTFFKKYFSKSKFVEGTNCKPELACNTLIHVFWGYLHRHGQTNLQTRWDIYRGPCNLFKVWLVWLNNRFITIPKAF